MTELHTQTSFWAVTINSAKEAYRLYCEPIHAASERARDVVLAQDWRHRQLAIVAIVAVAVLGIALPGGSLDGGQVIHGSPWESPLSRFAASLTGPVALSISLIALMVAGGTLVFGGELSEFARRSCVAVLSISFLVLGAGFMTALFGVGGGGDRSTPFLISTAIKWLLTAIAQPFFKGLALVSIATGGITLALAKGTTEFRSRAIMGAVFWGGVMIGILNLARWLIGSVGG